MTNFFGSDKHRTGKAQTIRSAARRAVGNRDVITSPLRNANTREGNRGFLGGQQRPEGRRA